MIRDNRGQVIFYGFMLGLTILVLALALADPVKEQIDTTRNASNMDCTNTSISTFDRSACIVTDLGLFYFIGGLIFIAGIAITAKIVFE